MLTLHCSKFRCVLFGLAQVRVEAMKTITKRLHRLADRFGLQPETKFDRRLRARINAARRRLADEFNEEAAHDLVM